MGIKSNKPKTKNKGTNADCNNENNQNNSNQIIQEMTALDENGDLVQWRKTCKETTSQVSLQITVTKTMVKNGDDSPKFPKTPSSGGPSTSSYNDYDYCNMFGGPRNIYTGYGSFIQPSPSNNHNQNHVFHQCYNMNQNQTQYNQQPITHCHAFYNGYPYAYFYH